MTRRALVTTLAALTLVACTTTTVKRPTPAPAEGDLDETAEASAATPADDTAPVAPGRPAHDPSSTDAGARAGDGPGDTCTKTTCDAQGKTCGTIPDGCGGTLDCGNVACDDGNPCTVDACSDGGVCQHTAKPDDTPCGPYLNQVCGGGFCGSVGTYCVDDDPDDFWNKHTYTGPGYSAQRVEYCSCEGNVLHATFDTVFAGQQDLANITCTSCKTVDRTLNGSRYTVTLCHR